MNEIAEVKTTLKNDLKAAGIDAIDYVDGRISPGIVIINSAAPYINYAEFKSFYINLELVIVIGQATNKVQTQAIDAQIVRLLKAITSLPYVHFKTVREPFELQANNTSFLATTLDISIVFKMNQE